MGSLREFLATQSERLPIQLSEAARKRDEWVAAVNRLTAGMKIWIAQADPERILTIRDLLISIREEGIGAYDVRGLAIGLGPREVRVEPIARYVAGPLAATSTIHVSRAFGRIDMTNGLERFLIFRTEIEPRDGWIIIPQDDLKVRPLDQAAFESALQSLLE